MLDRLWAGWRMSYVSSATDAAANSHVGPLGEEECVFCAILAAEASDEERLVVWRSERVLAMLNAFPYASGHLMVMPVRHLSALDELDEDEALELWHGVHLAVSALKNAYGPDGFNIGANFGRAAGAGIPDHLHVHAVPRWIGDTNFTTATASLRVLPEALPDSYERVRKAWP